MKKPDMRPYFTRCVEDGFSDDRWWEVVYQTGEVVGSHITYADAYHQATQLNNKLTNQKDVV